MEVAGLFLRSSSSYWLVFVVSIVLRQVLLLLLQVVGVGVGVVGFVVVVVQCCCCCCLASSLYDPRA